MQRGFDGLMTPGGLFLVVVAALLMIAISVGGALVWRLLEAESRRKRSNRRDP